VLFLSYCNNSQDFGREKLTNRMANNKSGGSQTPPSDETKPKKPVAPPPTIPAGEEKRKTATPAPVRQMTQRQLTRFEKDRRRQRQLTIAAIAIIAVMLVVIIVGVFQNAIAPNIKELATVNGQNISTGDYYKFRKLTLFKRAAQFQQILPSLGGDQQQQFQQQLQQIYAEIDSVQSFPVDQDTLETYAGILVADKAAKDEFSINPSDDDVNKEMTNQFGSELRLFTSTPDASGLVATPTVAAINTILANQVTATANAITPLPTATPSISPSPSPAATPTVVATASPNASVTAGATVNASGTVTATTAVSPTVAPTNTPVSADKAQQTVTASQGGFFDNLKKVTGLSQDDYKKLEIRPRLIKDLISKRLIQKLPKVGDAVLQLKASSIVSTERVTAVDIARDLKAASAADLPALFTKLAREKSINSVTAPKNGDLGWFIQYQLSNTATEDPLWDAANKLQVGQLSDPVKTNDGWEVIYLQGKEDKRPLDEREYKAQLDTDQNGDYRVYVRWLKDKTKTANPSYKTSPTPTTEPTQVPAAPFTAVIQPSATPVADTTTPASTGGTVVVGPLPVGGTPTPAVTTTAAATTTSVVTTTAAPTTAATASSATPAPTATK